jgi:putative transposase
MFRSTKTTLRFANKNKRESLRDFIAEYRSVVSRFVDLLWNQSKIPSLLPKEFTLRIATWLSARAVQCAGKQASGIVRGTRAKQERRLFVYNKLLKEGKRKQARKLKVIIDKTKVSKPDIKRLEPELDERFVKQDWNNPTSFDGFVTLSSLGNKLKIVLPVKRSKHFNKMLGRGVIGKGIRISENNISFHFEIEEPSRKTCGETVGLDIGVTNVFTMSNGVASRKNKHGHDLASINRILSRKTKGSNAFRKTQQHRKNYINWSLNQIDLDNVKTLKIENIKHLRRGKRSSRYLSHFAYTEIFRKLGSIAFEHGVRVEKVDPTYTSQRCSCCGWVRSTNRKGKQFRCVKCGFASDADLNASLNIRSDLLPIGKAERLLRKNRTGFCWNEAGKEPIVPSAQKPNGNKLP